MQILTERPLQNYAHDAAAVRRRSETYNSQENKQLCSQVPASHVIEPYGVCAGTVGGSFVEHVNYRCQSGSRHGAVKLELGCEEENYSVLDWIWTQSWYIWMHCVQKAWQIGLLGMDKWTLIGKYCTINITLVCSRYTETQWRPGWHHWWQLQ